MNRANGHRPVVIAPMELADVPQVAEIDRLSFPLPWSTTSYRYELTENKAAHFIVAAASGLESKRGLLARLFQQSAARLIVGYAGYWLVVDEAHIGTIATHPHWRGKGIGELLLVSLLHDALDHGALDAKLEVRVGNEVAQNLYRKYGFEEVGRRKHYYRDNGEDAVLMNTRLEGAVREHILDQHAASGTQELK
jgi:[ribosomal protein S18]-alanine N-acetyltransferase